MKNTHNTSQNNADEALNTKESNYMPEIQSVKYNGLNALNEQAEIKAGMIKQSECDRRNYDKQ